MGTSPIRAVLSPDAVTTHGPSGLNWADQTAGFVFERPSQWLACVWIPSPRAFVFSRGDDSLTDRTELRGTDRILSHRDPCTLHLAGALRGPMT